MKKRPQPLEFEFDDSSSMDEVLGYNEDLSDKKDTPSRKQLAELPPVNPLELPDDVDMGSLLEGEDLVEQEVEPQPVESPGMPTDIFEAVDQGSMQDLMSDDSSPDVSGGHITDIAIDGATVQLANGLQGFLNKGEFPDWSKAQVGDTVQVSYSDDNTGAPLGLSLISHDARAIPPKSQESNPRPFDGFKPGTRFVLDGSNICRSFAGDSGSSLAPLLSLIDGVMERDGECVCVFDANERYVLAQNSREPAGERVYEQILEGLSKLFIEAPATGTADDYLLKIAHRDRLAVISNDRFDKASDRHREQYPWLVSGGSRLIRGRVDGNQIIIPRLKLALPIVSDLTHLVQSIKLKVMSNAR